ncbi:caspase-like [Teleopsis dalmanni]|uniref:caspase-like n=1 Tax=Teleopsis dalmanni TaxID=139649 RepID=UPI0018CFA98E|nr:caspase-like [Teleopsis dalmanni]
MSGPGYALIFNNVNFDGAPNISSGKSDKKAIVKFLECFQIKYLYHEDLTKAEIERVMKKVEKMNFTRHSCIIIFILSHGDRTSIISAKDTKYNLEDTIIFSLLRNGSLDEKPKFLFIDTCKGKNTPEKIRNGDANVQRYPGQCVQSQIHDLYIPDYLLIFYSTYEGFVSYYDDRNGSIFTQTLCQYLVKYGHDRSLMYIIEKVMEAVKISKNGKQSPCITTNYLKSYCFGDYLNQQALFSEFSHMKFS